MADDKTKRGPADATRVNVNEDYEVRHWTQAFGCTETELRDCVKQVGVMAADVRKCIDKKKGR